MRGSRLALSAVLLATPAALRAQGTPNPECGQFTAVPQASNVCNAAIDGTRLFHPVAGLLIGGGNPRIGTAGTLGGLGHASIDVRATFTRVRLPDLNYNGTGTTVASTDSVLVPVPVLEVGIGLLKGSRHSGFGGLDLLTSAVFLPKSLIEKVNNLSVDTTGTKLGSVVLALGIGGRFQLLADNGVTPAISVSAMRRQLPTLTYGNLANGSQYQYAVNLQEWNYRAIVSKKVAIFALAAGGGFDTYTGNATIAFRNPVTNLPEAPITLALSQTRTIVFADAGVEFGGFRLTGEAGWQGGKDLRQVTTFQGTDPTKSRFYGGATIGIAF